MPILLATDSGPLARLFSRLGELGDGLVHGAFSVLVAAGVLAGGWVIAKLASSAMGRIAIAMRGSARSGRSVTADDGTPVEPGALVRTAAFWLVMILAAALASEVLGLRLGRSVASRLGEVVPRIITSALLFAIGTLVAIFVGRLTRSFLDNAQLRSSRMQGQVVTAVLTGFSGLLALEQLGFAAQFVMMVGVVAAATAGAGVALAFGLGCRELARDFVVEYLHSLKTEDTTGRS